MLILAFTNICGTYAAEVSLKRAQKEHRTKPLHALSFSATPLTAVNLNFLQMPINRCKKCCFLPRD